MPALFLTLISLALTSNSYSLFIFRCSICALWCFALYLFLNVFFSVPSLVFFVSFFRVPISLPCRGFPTLRTLPPHDAVTPLGGPNGRNVPEYGPTR
ncbi:hypothetical protein B9Z19DRAFT_560486 [Tuber borchii]|uniref:Uncharacterized protein n=1 Tax=Tuber borchii TaxID=42251 RepID=A0A2T7A8J3_TUBBO|nr:hypothetical protein B9Z19DRAFT_560486 [Tuber borchii]